MEGQLLWVLIVQLCVIVFVAVCILIFILKKLVGRSKVPTGSKTILVTAADSVIGTQIATHLASIGFRVFAGVNDVNSKASLRLKTCGSPWLHVIPLDVTNNDSLAYTIKAIGRSFHAGEKGLWAVLHLAGTGVKNSSKIGGDDEEQLRTALEVTVVGMYKLVQAFLPLLSAAKGRFIILGADDGMSLGLRVWGSGSIGITHGVWTAARFAAEGLAGGLRAKLRPHGVPVVSLHPDAFYAQRLNELPKPSVVYELRTESPVPGGNWSAATTLDESVPEFLSPYAIQAVEESILNTNPDECYVLAPSASSRIKSMMIAFSPSCVSNAVTKQHKHDKAEHIIAV
ncbi:D-beta-hydroxybutyrate dehydrogenase, mitochondrial [Folsomia candida]|uniref:D-beta-hydroxybutyrate dehydrogenase, mitochondrial n=1 Tax=Folsomia candida TaxID=158441 RepID=A0A226ES21_FOLCA|nr:D-beta-hydroxybutyrate dehydrogenase, mitochondrial [Folsomia candida]OXA60423.1 D-beta-hydroxybutyrate dehydrogenase, mitochondrial [Folsomia candida]